MNCLDNIVSIRNGCDTEAVQSLSGYDLMDAPELSKLTLANIANEDYLTGFNVAKKMLSLAKVEVRNDFLGVLSSNKVQANLLDVTYPTSEFQPNINLDSSNLERGITLYRNSKINGRLRKLKIKSVNVYPKHSKDNASLLVYDNGVKTTYNVNLIGGKVNTFQIDYTVKGSFARVLIDNTGLELVSSRLICHVGCNGSMPNDCGYTKGYNGQSDIAAKEGFGIGLEFSCGCDYEQILCDLAKSYVGKLIYLKARLLLLDERLYNNRNNNWTTYGTEEAKEIAHKVEKEYTQSWNTFVESLGNILFAYRDDCLNCRGAQWKTNI